MRRRAPFLALLALVLAGCGGEQTVSPRPQTVRGTVPKAAPAGKSVFDANGCGSCHTFAPAGSNGSVGPDLDKLADYAKKAKKPLDAFTRESIVDPNAYVESGYQKGVMPDFSKLSKDDVDALVQFLTTKS